MIAIEQAKSEFQRRGWLMRTAELRRANLFHYQVKQLVDNGMVEYVRRGYYQWIEGREVPDQETLTRLFPDAIYCMNTALYYYGYVDRISDAWHLAVDKRRNRKRFCLHYPYVKPYYVQPHLLQLGVSKQSLDGTEVRMYDRDRVMCDCLRYRNKMERETFNMVLRAYVADSRKNIANLLTYAQILRCEKSVKNILEPWL